MVRLVDLRNSAPPPTLEVVVQASAAAELARLLGLLYTEPPGEYDVGQERIDAIRETVPEAVAAEIVALRCGPLDYFNLPLLAVDLPHPAGVEELLAYLQQDLTTTWRLFLSLAARYNDELGASVAERILAGDDAAIDQACTFARTELDEQACAFVALDPEDHGHRMIRLIETFNTSVFAKLAAEAMGPIERDAAHRIQRLADGVDPLTVILEATNGYEPSTDAGLRRVVLLPSYWMRPWLLLAESGGDTEVISTVVADEFLVLPSEEPPPALIKLTKALADASRLRLLRRMASGPISLSQASEALDVTKATAHHHLSILRQAGLVAMRGSGRSTRYSLRTDPAEAARAALADYGSPSG